MKKNKMSELLAWEEILKRREFIINNYKELDCPELAFIAQELKMNHHEIYKLANQKRKELKEAITPSLFQSAIVQDYLGIYRQQKGPYAIESITPIDETTLQLNAFSMTYYPKYHKNDYDQIKQELIFIKELRGKGIFRYKERELIPNKESNFADIRVANLSLKDPEKNGYVISMMQRNQEAILFDASNSAYKEKSNCLRGSIIGGTPLNSSIIQEEFSKTCKESQKASKLSHPEYFAYLEEQGSELDLLHEIERQRTLQKNKTADSEK